MTNVSAGDSQSGSAGEDAYRRLLEGTADHALFMLDPQGRVSLWPEVAQRLYGYEAGDMIGRRVDRLFADIRGTPPPSKIRWASRRPEQ